MTQRHNTHTTHTGRKMPMNDSSSMPSWRGKLMEQFFPSPYPLS